MQYTIAEVAKELEVSKNTVYNRLKGLQKDLKPFVKVTKGITYIEEEGMEIIRKAVYVENEETKENETIEADNVNPFQALQEDYINTLKTTIEMLERDKEDLKNQLTEQTEIVKRQQILQLNEQYNTKQTILMLEEHNKEIDEKLTSWRSEQQEKQQEKKTGLFAKLFNK
jgi:predicted DNA-binding protein YlxM (UPF0122 family)